MHCWWRQGSRVGGIPLRCPPKDQLIHTRRNGKFCSEITGHLIYGLAIHSVCQFSK